MKKLLFILFSLLMSASSAWAENCVGNPWLADINKDCGVDNGDFSQMAKFWLVPRETIQYIADPGGTPILIQPEDPLDATLTGEAQIDFDAAWRINFADDSPTGSGIAGNIGIGEITLVNELPAGSYFIQFGWQTRGWAVGGGDGIVLVRLSGLGAGGQENGTFEPGGWHDVRPDPIGGTDSNATSAFYNDVVIGPAMGPTADTLPASAWGSNMGDWGTALTVGAGNQVKFEFQETAVNGSILLYDITFVPAIIELPLPAVAQDIIIQAEDCNPVPTQATSPDSYVRVTADGAFVMSDFPGTDNATGTGTFTIPVAIPDGDYEVMVRLNTGAIIASGGNWGIKLGATTGSVIENGGGDGTEHSYNLSGPNTLPNTWYDSWFASPEGDAAWYGDIWNAVDGGPTPQLPTSVTLSGIGADDLFFEIRDGMSHNSSYTFIDYFKFVPVIPGDFDQSDLVDFDDLIIFAEQFLHCNDPADPGCTNYNCGSKPGIGITKYTAHDVTTTSPLGAVTIDGSLSDWPALDVIQNDPDWCAGKWVEMDLTYFGVNNFSENVFMCLMYDATTDLVYGAVVARDFDPFYGWTGWDQQDSIEVYIQGDISTVGDPNFVNPYGDWAFGQQFMIGVEPDSGTPTNPALDTTFKLWPDGTNFTVGPDPGLTAVAKRTVNGPFDDNLIYEFVLVPYDNYGGYDLSPTVQTDLTPGKQFGFDVVLANLSPFSPSFGMRCANLKTGKSGNVAAYGTATCE